MMSADPHRSRCVLITGAAGSIGSALARSLAAAGARLLLLDFSEIGLFELQQQLTGDFEIVLGSVDDPVVLDSLFQRHPVDIVYHAAAWKQVPLLETNPFAALRNNAFATHVLAQAALRASVSKLVLVSTDKAVNPRSILGASKRIAELLVTALSSAACRMNAIRLCNVIGSSGSVVPIFQRQIAQHQALTVTGPEARRWFLPMQNAVDSIRVCGASAQSGKIFLPPVGEPVRIADLARDLIQAVGNGWRGGIQYIGLRPGDKLAEELRYTSECQVGMEGSLTVLETPGPNPADLSAFLDDLRFQIERLDLRGTLRVIQSVIPEYEPSQQLVELAARMAASV